MLSSGERSHYIQLVYIILFWQHLNFLNELHLLSCFSVNIRCLIGQILVTMPEYIMPVLPDGGREEVYLESIGRTYSVAASYCGKAGGA